MTAATHSYLQAVKAYSDSKKAHRASWDRISTLTGSAYTNAVRAYSKEGKALKAEWARISSLPTR